MVKFRKFVRKARKGVRKAARLYVKAKRTAVGKAISRYASRRIGNLGFSSTKVAKSLSRIRKDMSAGLEWKTLDQAHTTVGSPDVALRYFWRISASANMATQYSTTTPGTAGYLFREISLPSKGDDQTQYDGQKFLVKSIQMKGSCALLATGDQTTANGTLRLMILKYTDSVDSTANITELLKTDNNGEYSIQSRRDRDNYRDYHIIASRNIKLAYGSKTKTDFNIMVYPNQTHRHDDAGATSHKVRYYAVAIASPDISSHMTQFDLNFFTRMRFIH